MSKAIINALALSLTSISSAGDASERCKLFVYERDGMMLLKFMLKFMGAAGQRGRKSSSMA